MVIPEKKLILVLRYNEFRQYSFISEHESIINKNGCVWMMKFGRSIPDKSIKNVIDESGLIILKEPKKSGGKYFCAHVCEYRNVNTCRTDSSPHYYYELLSSMEDNNEIRTWLRIDELCEIDQDIVDEFYLTSNGRKLKDVIGETRTSAMYVQCDRKYELEGR